MSPRTTNPSGPPERPLWLSPDPVEQRPRPDAESAAPPRRRPRGNLPAFWGGALLLGGIVLWSSIPARDQPTPDVWRETGGPKAPPAKLENEIRGGGPNQGNLLRLEWPAHPNARRYVVRFRDAAGNGPAPVTVQSTVFLYDLESDVLRLPKEFAWEVVAVLPDGSEVVTPAGNVQLDPSYR